MIAHAEHPDHDEGAVDIDVARVWSESGCRAITHADAAVPARLVTTVVGVVDALDRAGAGVAERFGATPFDVDGVFWSHRGERCSFDTMIEEFGLSSPALDQLAADCVRVFDRFRAPPSEAELARRRRRGLTAEEEANLKRWGYPRVMQLFEFHMTLTEKLGAEEHARAVAALSGLLGEALAAPLPVDGIALYAEAETDGPFALLGRYAFGR